MEFDVFRKRGKGWQLLGIYKATDSRKAAQKANFSKRCNVLGVRPADTSTKLFVYRFKTT